MNRIRIYDPPLCCSTGVCGVDVDAELVRVSADIDALRRQGADIARHNLATDPLEFAGDDTVKAFLQVAGSAGLPLVTVGGVTVLTGTYPSRQQLQTWSGVAAGDVAPLPVAESGCCAPAEGADAAEAAAAPAGGSCC